MTTPDEIQEFTKQEFLFIIGACWGLPNREIAKQCEISEEIVMRIRASAFDKAGLSVRAELFWVCHDRIKQRTAASQEGAP